MHRCSRPLKLDWIKGQEIVITNNIRKEIRNVCVMPEVVTINHDPLLYIPIGFQHSEARSMQKRKKV